jgi:hypothetical protein
MRKRIVALTVSIVIFVAALSGALLINSARANPYSHIFPIPSGEVDPRSDTQPPKITILSPEHNSTFNTTSLPISFKVEVGESKSAYSSMVWNVYYETDWLENQSYVYEYVPNSSQQPNPTQTEYSTILNLTGIPEGRHSIIIFATERGTYYEPPFSEWPMWALEFEVKSYGFQIVGASTIAFIVDVTPLTVTVFPVTSRILSESGAADVALNFTVNGSASRISYALDGQDNVTIAGNATLPSVSIGEHNVRVYAWDAAGNVGVSEIVVFTVAEPESFPTVLVVLVSAASIVAVATGGLLVYHKRRFALVVV